MKDRPIDFYLVLASAGMFFAGLWLTNLKRAATISSMKTRWAWALLLMASGLVLILSVFIFNIPKVN